MPALFDQTQVSSMRLANRFVRSATWEGMASGDGYSTPELDAYVARLAAGAVGLSISSYAYVSPEGRDAPGQLGVCSDDHVPGLTAMAQATHEAGGRIALQLAHAGCFGEPSLSGIEPVGPSPLVTADGPRGRAMSHIEIAALPAAFATAAQRAYQAGFDAVQVHAAHGYLLSQFLSPYFNRRKDGYGGGVEQRSRLLLQVITGVRDAVGSEYPVLVKMNAADFLPNGLSVEDMLEVAAMLEAAGVDAIELSGGTGLEEGLSFSRTGRPAPGEPEAYYEDAAWRFKAEIGVPLMLCGGIRTYETAQRLVAEGATDYLALSRPLIREPGLVARWHAGDTAPSRCISDNGCFDTPDEDHGLFCAIEERKTRKARE